MLLAILSHTPAWVWALFAGLTAYGLSQTRTRDIALSRVTIVPLVFVVLSASGVFSAFGGAPLALGGWAAGVGAAFAFARHVVAVQGAVWLAERNAIRVPGSWLPLFLMTGIFALKYAAGVTLALHPALARDTTFASACSLAYGAFAGLFLARGWSLRAVAASPRMLPTR